jgi:KUP system potassium uptake protein
MSARIFMTATSRDLSTVHPSSAEEVDRSRLLPLSIAALGVVYGDIGTSPLYALRECFFGPHAVEPTRANVLGVLSLVFWSLVLVIAIKYIVFVMRADNRGEGGILALASILKPPAGKRVDNSRRYAILLVLGLFGASLFYGDGMITPAISVLSAIEGLEVATPVFAPWIQPITIAILVALFLVQKRGTAGVGAVFGPVTFVWFLAIAALGVRQILVVPDVLLAVNPFHAVQFFLLERMRGFLVLGAVFLVVTGGEALYADMGHFGTRPIRLTWFALVMPALLLNYFGQGALLLTSPETAVNPFYKLAPGWALYPLVVLATAATVIASQAVISGAFSLTRQAVLLGYVPRMRIDHTSETEIGQIYIPLVNRVLLVSCVLLVVGFRSSSNLAAAYGIAVTTTMVITAILIGVVAVQRWRWSVAVVIPLIGLFLFVDLAFFGANVIKIAHGGWFPIVIALVAFTLMTTWKLGRRILEEKLRERSLDVEAFASSLAARPVTRVPGVAVFMHRATGRVPSSLLHSLKHYKVLHEANVLLSVVVEDVPWVDAGERASVENLGAGLYRVVVRYGFMQDPDIPKVLESLRVEGLDFEPMQTSYFLGRETLVPTKHRKMWAWREKLFIWMSTNAVGAGLFFRLPPNRVVELGAQVEV